ncbi:MAG: hypothetical protein EAZ97_16275 [Bacteroidetes bacterium]|nr:MAG: hypothetical protein EAZ97_16275 [Bacteroidota bacterium]
MKQILSFGLLAIYLLFNTGVAVSWHFCANQLESIGFFVKAKSCTCQINSESKNDCCKDEKQIFKTDDNLHSQPDVAVFKANFSDILEADFSVHYFYFHHSSFRVFRLKSYFPKIPSWKIPFWLAFRVLRI